MEFINEWFWFFLLLPLAALSGWVIGRRGGERHSDSQVSKLSTTYFRGLNYLLNEQPDKAIELFLHIAELDKDTFETQIALGHLFRRRGEVDRAIRLHQGLVQRNDLTDQQRVVLAAAAQDLDHALHFLFAPDQRIDAAVGGSLVQVLGELIQRAFLGLAFDLRFFHAFRRLLAVDLLVLAHAVRNEVDHVETGHAFLMQEVNGV